MKNRFDLRYEVKMEADTSSADILLYGAIVSYKWDKDDPDCTPKEFHEKLKELKSAGVKNIHLRINSGGGEVFSAVAMRTMLISESFDTVSVSVEGLCASAATLLCTIPNARVTISRGSQFMIHNPSTMVWGNAEAMEKEAAHLRQMEEQFIDLYTDRCGKEREKVRDWMDAETWFTAEEAVDNGFCDELTGETAAAACLTSDTITAMRDIYRNTPENLTAANVESAAPTAQAVTENDTTSATDASAGVEFVNTTMEGTDMDISQLTMRELMEGNPELYASVISQGAVAERERVGEIDALTPAGYEALAEQAKASGASSADFLKSVVKAQKEKASAFLTERVSETAPAANVAAGSVEDSASEEEEMQKNAREVASYAKTSGNNSMF